MLTGASYVASDCHRRDSANANRDNVVYQLREAGIRIDGLGRCMKSHIPEGYWLPHTADSHYNLVTKREVISKYMFYMAFENSLEPGYVTEKPFDALIGGNQLDCYESSIIASCLCIGTVPVYLGDHNHLKSMLPHPDAAIFVEDFNNNYTALAEYLTYLISNETAYEEHRNWRYNFNHVRHRQDKALLRHSWTCRICRWSVETSLTHHHHKTNKHCDDTGKDITDETKTGKYLIANGLNFNIYLNYCIIEDNNAESSVAVVDFKTDVSFYEGKAVKGQDIVFSDLTVVIVIVNSQAVQDKCFSLIKVY